MSTGAESSGVLKREIGLGGAIVLGIGSMVGTGVFVSIGLGAGAAGAAVLPAILAAGALAGCNALGSAQLAAAHPVSGGTYEYAYRFLFPTAGFAAGLLFVAAKCASAATAALGIAGYGLALIPGAEAVPRVPAALVILAVACGVALAGARLSTRVVAVLVAASLGALALFVAVATGRGGGGAVLAASATDFTPGGFYAATALMFVAFTGYGRIATLGEEVHDPSRTIPRAIIATTLLVTALYLAVALAGLSAMGAGEFARAARESGAPLAAAASALGSGWLRLVVSWGALAAMASVLLNLILGISRVVLAMGRRGDLPRGLARVGPDGRSATAAVLFSASVIAVLVIPGSIALAWSASAFTVLVYYAITNVAALRLPRESRRYPRVISWIGLAGCAILAFGVPPAIWVGGVCFVALGLAARATLRRSISP